MEKIGYINALRGLAAFLIILIHCNIFTNNTELLSKVWMHFLYEWTAVFVLISGFLFQYLLPRYNQRKFYKNKIKNVIIPYLFVSIPAILIYVLGLKSDHNWVDIPELLDHSYLYIVTFFLATGAHLGPLWFIPVLILIFLTSKPLSIIGNNKSYLLFFSILSVFLIGLTSRAFQDSNPLIAYAHFLPVYIIGMFICSNRNILIKLKYKNILLFVFLIFFIIGLYFDFGRNYSIYTKIFLFMYLCILFDSIKEAKLKLFNILADISFAMYFLHGYFVGVLRKIISVTDYGFVSGFLLNIASGIFITFFIFIIYYVLNKLKFNSRILIGS